MEKGFASFNTYIIYPEQILKRISRTAWRKETQMNIKKAACAAAAVLTALVIGGCSVKVGTNTEIKDDKVVAESTAENTEKIEITYLD